MISGETKNGVQIFY